MIKRLFYTLLVILSTALTAGAQELNCTVEVNADQVQGSNRSVFETLKSAITEYMNTTQFTQAQFSTNEKIECRLFFTIKEYSNDVMTGDLQIQSIRPVYNSTYTTTLINFKDNKIEFEYQEGQPLIHNLSQMENQLTAILNFYAYLILAVDFDSFSPQGGEPYWDIVSTIVQQAQSSGESGWRQFEDTKNRSAVLSAYTDANTSVLRDLTYDYHRNGLDQMTISPDKGRAQITKSLQSLSDIYQINPMSVGLSMWRDAKLDEIVNIYTKASQTERDNVYNLLKDLYPTDSERVNLIRTGGKQQ